MSTAYSPCLLSFAVPYSQVAYSSSSEAGKEKPSWASAFYLLNEMLDVLNHSQVRNSRLEFL
jgi:hypothetical protein